MNFGIKKNKTPNPNRPTKGPATNYPNAQRLASSQAAAAPLSLSLAAPPSSLCSRAHADPPTRKQRPLAAA
jgi:hypothetical protein